LASSKSNSGPQSSGKIYLRLVLLIYGIPVLFLYLYGKTANGTTILLFLSPLIFLAPGLILVSSKKFDRFSGIERIVVAFIVSVVITWLIGVSTFSKIQIVSEGLFVLALVGSIVFSFSSPTEKQIGKDSVFVMGLMITMFCLALLSDNFSAMPRSDETVYLFLSNNLATGNISISPYNTTTVTSSGITVPYNPYPTFETQSVFLYILSFFGQLATFNYEPLRIGASTVATFIVPATYLIASRLKSQIALTSSAAIAFLPLLAWGSPLVLHDAFVAVFYSTSIYCFISEHQDFRTKAIFGATSILLGAECGGFALLAIIPITFYFIIQHFHGNVFRLLFALGAVSGILSILALVFAKAFSPGFFVDIVVLPSSPFQIVLGREYMLGSFLNPYYYGFAAYVICAIGITLSIRHIRTATQFCDKTVLTTLLVAFLLPLILFGVSGYTFAPRFVFVSYAFGAVFFSIGLFGFYEIEQRLITMLMIFCIWVVAISFYAINEVGVSSMSILPQSQLLQLGFLFPVVFIVTLSSRLPVKSKRIFPAIVITLLLITDCAQIVFYVSGFAT
jgi:hypothetical protein